MKNGLAKFVNENKKQIIVSMNLFYYHLKLNKIKLKKYLYF